MNISQSQVGCDMREKVTIIIPVYNAESTIKRTIDSLLNQTYKNCNIIIVNDGSTDHTADILDKYAQEYKNISVFTKPNGGAGSARNIGLKNINECDWVAFVDADDYVDDDYIEKMMGYDVDIVVSGYISHDHDVITGQYRPEKQLLSISELRRMYYDVGGFAGPCHKLYRLKAIGDTLFDETLKTGEDGIFNLDIFNNVHNVQYVDYCGYHICAYANSLTHKNHSSYSPMLDIEWQKWWGDRCYKARQNAGVQESREIRSNSVYRFQMLLNLFKSDTPYDAREKKRRIKQILNDKEYRENIFKAEIIESKKTHIIMKAFMIINSANLVYIIFSISKKYLNTAV